MTFFWRRFHSLMGLWLVIYLFEHLLINSLATFSLGEDGSGFIRMVNSLESLPYLRVVEVLLIGVPLLVHGVWGVRRALSARTNSVGFAGNEPALPYGRNRAFTWQRLTSWILLFGILGHVAQMRFWDQPKELGPHAFAIEVSGDPGLPALAERLHVQLMPQGDCWLAVAPDAGTGMLLMVRDVFKSPWMMGLYAIFVLSAAFHAFNGLWTFLITWGVLLSVRSQRACLPLAWCGVALLAFWGLAAIGCYWVNLR